MEPITASLEMHWPCIGDNGKDAKEGWKYGKKTYLKNGTFHFF